MGAGAWGTPTRERLQTKRKKGQRKKRVVWSPSVLSPVRNKNSLFAKQWAAALASEASLRASSSPPSRPVTPPASQPRRLPVSPLDKKVSPGVQTKHFKKGNVVDPDNHYYVKRHDSLHRIAEDLRSKRVFRAVYGHSQSGKSTLAQMLVASNLFPAGAVLSIKFGKEECAQIGSSQLAFAQAWGCIQTQMKSRPPESGYAIAEDVIEQARDNPKAAFLRLFESQDNVRYILVDEMQDMAGWGKGQAGTMVLDALRELKRRSKTTLDSAEGLGSACTTSRTYSTTGPLSSSITYARCRSCISPLKSTGSCLVNSFRTPCRILPRESILYPPSERPALASP